MPVENLWIGRLTPTSVWVRGKVDGSTVKLLVSTNSNLTDPTEFGPVSPTNDIASIEATNLDHNTVYHFAFEVDEVTDTDWQGSFRTMPEEGMPATFRWWAASCAGNGGGDVNAFGMSNAPVFDVIRSVEPLFGVHMGDLFYRDNLGTDPEAYHQVFDNVLTYNGEEGADARQAKLYRNVPIAYVWDDHDSWGPNNSDGNDTGKAQSQQVYRERVPHYDLDDSEGIWQTFVCGRVRFILLDTRSYRNVGGSANHLGSDQKAWLKNLLSTVEEPLVVLASTVPWISSDNPSSGSWHEDAWGAWSAEREELADHIASVDGLIDRLVIVGGDGHFLGWDDGTNSDYSTTEAGGFPVFQNAPMDCSTSVKGGPYSGGTSVMNQSWGNYRVVDDNDKITLIADLTRDGGSVWQQVVLEFPADPVELPDGPTSRWLRAKDGNLIRAKGGGFLRGRTPA